METDRCLKEYQFIYQLHSIIVRLLYTYIKYLSDIYIYMLNRFFLNETYYRNRKQKNKAFRWICFQQLYLICSEDMSGSVMDLKLENFKSAQQIICSKTTQKLSLFVNPLFLMNRKLLISFTVYRLLTGVYILNNSKLQSILNLLEHI